MNKRSSEFNIIHISPSFGILSNTNIKKLKLVKTSTVFTAEFASIY